MVLRADWLLWGDVGRGRTVCDTISIHEVLHKATLRSSLEGHKSQHIAVLRPVVLKKLVFVYTVYRSGSMIGMMYLSIIQTFGSIHLFPEEMISILDQPLYQARAWYTPSYVTTCMFVVFFKLLPSYLMWINNLALVDVISQEFHDTSAARFAMPRFLMYCVGLKSRTRFERFPVSLYIYMYIHRF